MSNLIPDRTIQKLLISTTSRFVGHYETEKLVFTHAWPDFYDGSINARISEGPSSRSAYIAAIRTPPIDPQAKTLPNYAPWGEIICSYLAVLFGKRFDSHGLVEGTGFFHVPDLSAFNSLCDPRLPQNSHAPRKDLGIPLNLTEVTKIERLLLDESLDPRFERTMQTSAKFYLQALLNAERDPEIAYLHLITSGEVLSNFFDYDKTELLDESTRQTIKLIETTLGEGITVANQIRSRLFQVKRRFTKTVCRLVNSHFFDNTECTQQFGALKQQDFAQRIAAAYDLRSRYLHTGIPFGRWVSSSIGGWNNEVQFGHPVVNDSELGQILERAPTYCGLERVIRYCLLRFAHINGISIDPRLQDDGVA